MFGKLRTVFLISLKALKFDLHFTQFHINHKVMGFSYHSEAKITILNILLRTRPEQSLTTSEIGKSAKIGVIYKPCRNGRGEEGLPKVNDAT